MKHHLVAVLLLLVLVVQVRAEDSAAFVNLAWLDSPYEVPATPYVTEEGGTGTLAGFRGKAVVLNFWATWCPPCLKELPSLDRLAGRHGGDHLAVVTMAMDRASEERIREFHIEHGLANLGIYRDPTMRLARSMKLFGLPTTFLIDHKSQVVAQLVGEAEWDSPQALAVIQPLAAAAAGETADP